MKKARIAYCIPALYYPGGMERVLTIKANYLAEKGYDIHIIITDGQDKKPYYQLHPTIKVHQLDIDYESLHKQPIHIKFFNYLKKQRLFRKKLSACLFTVKPDITISMLRRDINFITKIKDGSIKIGEIHFNRTNYRSFADNRFPHFIQKFIKNIWMNQLIRQLKRLSRFVVLSYEDQKEWKELNNTLVIHNPLPFYPENLSDCEAKQVIAVGRYVEQKGFDRLIDAWAIVEKKHPEWTLKIYGDGFLRNPLQNQIHDLKLKNCILEHNTPNIRDKYIESSIFVLSSRFEGFGMVLAEAMLCGLSTVSFTCPCGPKDIIETDDDGFLVENGDVVQLAEKIIYLIENKDIRLKMGKNAAKSAQRFLPEIIMPKWESLFNSLLNEKNINEVV